MGYRIILELSSVHANKYSLLFEGIGKQTRRFVVIIRDETRAEKVGAVLKLSASLCPTASLPPLPFHLGPNMFNRFAPATSVFPPFRSTPFLFSRQFITSLSLPDRSFVAFGRDKKRGRKSGHRFSPRETTMQRREGGANSPRRNRTSSIDSNEFQR